MVGLLLNCFKSSWLLPLSITNSFVLFSVETSDTLWRMQLVGDPERGAVLGGGGYKAEDDGMRQRLERLQRKYLSPKLCCPFWRCSKTKLVANKRIVQCSAKCMLTQIMFLVMLCHSTTYFFYV